jgi:MFS family permease
VGSQVPLRAPKKVSRPSGGWLSFIRQGAARSHRGTQAAEAAIDRDDIMVRMSAITLLREPHFRRIFLAQSVSTLGDNIAPIAVTFAVLATQHSATDLGLVLAARTLPLVLFVVIGGAWADRLPRKSLMVASDLVRLCTQGAFALILIGHSPALWAMILLQAGNGAATAFFRPASSGLVQEAVPVPERQSANALLSATTNISSIAGPVVAALLIAFAGNAWAVGIDALSFGVSALFLYRVVVPPRAPRERIGIGREIAEGFRAIVASRWLGLEILAFSEFQLFVLASYSVLGPLVAQKHYAGATTWAIVAAVSGVGALLGDAISLRIKPKRPLLVANAFSLCCAPLLVALAFTAPIPVLIGCAALFGVGLSVPDTLWFTAMQENVPDHLMARVSAFDWMGSTALRPIGLAVVAPIAAITGPAAVLVVAAGVSVLTLVGVTSHPSVRGLRRGGPANPDVVEPPRQ